MLPGCRHWGALLPERPGVTIEDIDVFAGRCLIHERHDGQPALSILRLPRALEPQALGLGSAPESVVGRPTDAVGQAGGRAQALGPEPGAEGGAGPWEDGAWAQTLDPGPALRTLRFRPEAGAMALASGANPDFHAKVPSISHTNAGPACILQMCQRCPHAAQHPCTRSGFCGGVI